MRVKIYRDSTLVDDAPADDTPTGIIVADGLYGIHRDVYEGSLTRYGEDAIHVAVERHMPSPVYGYSIVYEGV